VLWLTLALRAICRLPQFQLVVQPKNFSRLPHGHSLSRHRHLLVGGHATRGLVSSVARLFSTADSWPSRSPVLRPSISDRLRPGMVIAFAQEHWSESGRNRDRNHPAMVIGFSRNPHLDSGMKVWLFQAGWYIDRDSSLRADFANAGCTTPHEYGRNILVCPAVLGPP